MAVKPYQQALNVGQFDRDKLHRVDLERMRLAAERQVNLLCDAVGPAWARPGTEFLTALKSSTYPGRLIAFEAGEQDAFILEFTDGVLRVLDCDTDALVTRAAVGSAVTNGDFGAAGSWTLASTAGQSTAISGGKLTMKARAHGGLAKAKQTVTTTSVGAEHAVRVVVERGPVSFRIGSTDGGAEYLPAGAEAVLEEGTHSIAFTPTASPYYLELSSESPTNVIVDSCQIEGAGVLELATPWVAAALPYLRVEQSLDVMYVGCDGLQPMVIERRGDHSWGLRKYKFADGPFLPVRSADVTLTPAATEGNTTLTASRPFFTANHVGAIFRLYHEGQKVETFLAGDNEYTPPFIVSGITETNVEDRKWTVTVAGTWAGTLRHQHSYDGADGKYTAYRRAQTVATIDITANATFTNDDNDDNIDEWYRMGFEPGTYTSGEAQVTFAYAGGGGYGIARVIGYTSPTVVDIEVLVPFKGKHATKDWREGQWSNARGWPAAPVMHDGRLTWVGSDQFAGSVSDGFNSFDEDFEGDAGPILRSIALGGRNEARWGLSLNTLMVGCDSRIVGARASSLDEILTPDNFGLKSAGKVGTAAISPAELADDRAVFVQNAGNVLYEITWSTEKGRYVVSPFSKLTAGMFTGGIRCLAVQTLPDQRIWSAVNESDAVCIIFEPSQQVLAAHVPISTSRDGEYFEDFAVVSGTDQDRVYCIVKRVIGGNTVRYLEKFAKDAEAKVGDVCKVMDSHVSFGAGSAVVTGLGHLEGETVVAWVDGAPVDELEALESLLPAGHDTDFSAWPDILRVTLTGGQLGPAGGTAYSVLETAPVGTHHIADIGLDIEAGINRFTAQVKPVGRHVSLALWNNSFANALDFVIDDTGAVAAAPATSGEFTLTDYSVEALGDGWFAMTVELYATADSPDCYLIVESRAGAFVTSFAGDPTKGFWLAEVTLERMGIASGTAKEFTVAGGQITLPLVPAIGGCVGLAYDYQFKSARFALGLEGATPMGGRKSIAGVTLFLGDFCRSGVRYGVTQRGAEFAATLSLPRLSGGTGTDAEEIVAGPADDEDELNVGSGIGFDNRLCVAGRSPKPLTLLSYTIAVEG